MKSRVFSSKLLKNNVSGGIWVPVILAIGSFFTFPVVTLLLLGNWSTYYQLAEKIQYFCNTLYSHRLLETGIFVISAAAFLNALLGYFYLYSREKVDFFHSLPLKRHHMFLQKLYMGFIYTVVPYVIMVFLSLFILMIRGYFHLGILISALQMMAAHLITYLFLYFCFVLIFSMTGTILMGVLSIFGLFLYGPALQFLLAGYQSEFFKNYSGSTAEWMQLILRFTPYNIVRILCVDSLPSLGNLLAAMFFTILFGILSYLAYAKRPSEATGNSIVYYWFGVLLKYAMVIPCGLVFGLVMYSIQPAAQNIWGLFGLIAGTILSKGMMEVLYTFDFRSFLKNKVQTLIALTAVFAAACIFFFDPFDYAGYLPAYEKLNGINMALTYNASCRYVKVNENGEVQGYNYMADECILQKNDSELGEKTYQVLKDIIAESKLLTNYEPRYTHYTVEYRLKSGGYAFRNYAISDENVKKLYQALYEETNLKEQELSILDIDAEKYLRETICTFHDGQEYDLFANMPEKKKAFTDALRADILEASVEERTEPLPVALVELRFANVPFPDAPAFPDPDTVSLTQDHWGDFLIYPSFKRTIALLSETGFPLSVKEIDCKEASVYINIPNEIQETPVSSSVLYANYGPFQITEEKDVEEIVNSVHLFDNPWTSSEDGIYVTFSSTTGEESSPYHFQKGALPACIQDLLDKINAGEIEETIYD